MLRAFLIGAAALVLVGVGLYFTVAARVVDRRMNRVAQPPPYEASTEAARLHDRLFVADLHNDLLLWNRDPLQRHAYGHTDVPRLVEGGVGLQVFSVVTKSPWGQSYDRTEGDSDRIPYLVAAQRWPLRTWTSQLERALHQAQKLRDAAAHSEGRLTVLRSQADLEHFLIQRVEAPDRLAGLLALEGLHALEGDLTHLDTLYAAGFRMMAPTHMFDNALGGSASGVAKGGLTDFGRQVVRWMEERHVIIDLAHASEAVIDDVLALTEHPVVVSHTGVDATCPGPRNLSDRHLEAITARGGLVGVGFWPGAVCGTTPDAIVRAVAHVADLVGVEHVALGSDFDGTVLQPFDATGLTQITEALLDAGFTEAEIRQIVGGNVVQFLRRALPPADAPTPGELPISGGK